MKHLRKIIGAFLAISLLLGTAAAVPVEDVSLLQEETTVSDHNGYIVKLRNDRNRVRLQSADDALEPIAHAEDYFVAQTIEELLPYLAADMVESVDANVQMELLDDEPTTPPLTNDPEVSRQWYLERIHAASLWNNGLEGDGVTIALIDSGVMSTHEDLAGTTIEGRNFCGGVVENVLQYADMYEDTNANGHGTAVTGIIAARRNNEIGVAGMLNNVKILSLRCFSPDNTKPQDVRGNYVDTVISAIGYAMEQGADVINMSIGVRQQVTALEAKLREAADQGIILVAAAGNYGVTAPNEPIYPASYDFVVSVAAIKADNRVMDSSQKNNQVTVAAPGNAIWTTSNSGGYDELSGTSLASPIVTALAAVVKQKDSKIDTDGFVRLMQRSAIDRGDEGRDDSYGWGTVDAQRLISAMNSSHSISYATSGGTMPEEYKNTYKIAQDVGTELPIPTRGSHDVFVGWYLDEELTKGPYTTFPAGCAGNITLWAGWKQAALAEATVKLVRLGSMEDVTATQGEDGVWTAMLPDGTTSAFIASLKWTNIEIAGVEASGAMRIAADGTQWSFTVGDTPYTLNIPVPKPLRTTETWEGTATPASLDGSISAVSCRMPVAQWFTGDIVTFAKATADLPKELGSLGITADKKTMVFTPTAAAAGQTLTARIYARNAAGLSEPAIATIVVGELPVSQPVLAETEKIFQKGTDGDIAVGMTLYGNTVSGVTVGDETLTETAYTVDGETLTLKGEWMNTLNYGDYVLTVSFANGTSATLTLKVRIPKPIVVLNPATGEGTATPASLDGTIEAIPFVQEDVSAWFGGDVDGYLCTTTDGVGTVSVEGSKITYTPAAADAEKEVNLEIRAKNGTGESEAVVITVAVAAAPKSDPKIGSTGLTFRTTSVNGVAARVYWNGATLVKVTCDNEAIPVTSYTVSEQDNTLTFSNAWLKTLTVGEHSLRFFFSDCRTENLSLSLSLTVSRLADGTSNSGLTGAIAGIAQAMASNPSVEIPEANVTMFYTPNGGKVDLTVDDAEAARLAQCETISISFPAGDVLAAQITDKIYNAPKNGTFLKFPKGSFFIRSTAPVSGNRSFALNSPSQNVWYVSFTGDPAGVTVLLPCAQTRWKATLRTATGERVLPSVYDAKEGCLRVVMPESGTLTLTQDTMANPFKDVAAGAWYHDAVQNAYGTNLLQGVSADKFAPDTPVSRAMLVTILRRLSGNTENVATTFTDVAPNAWYAGAAAWAQKEKLVNGYPDGSFRPDAPVSRQELMTIFWRFAALQGAAKESAISVIADYADVSTLAEYAVAPVCGMVANGIVNGVGSNPARLAPTEGATRAQLAVILQRYVEHLSGK